MSDAKNDSVNNLLNEEDAGSVKLQKLDDSSINCILSFMKFKVSEQSLSFF